MSIIDEILATVEQEAPEEDTEAPEHRPEMLLIGCIDARKDPTADLGIPRGKALILRNIAALIKGKTVDSGQRESEAAALEFAVKVMKVKHIAVMGHTDCGGIRAALEETELPAIKDYLSPLDTLKNNICASGVSSKEKQRMMEKEAVRMSVQNLLSYDYIKKAVDDGALSIHGWVINIATGKLIKIV